MINFNLILNYEIVSSSDDETEITNLYNDTITQLQPNDKLHLTKSEDGNCTIILSNYLQGE